jgi:hypothetical protein
MEFHHRIPVIALAILFALCTTAQAAGIEFTAVDPVLYVDETPVFILEDLTARLGMRKGEGASAWFELYGGDAKALTADISAGAGGIFAAVSGVSSAYGLSGATLAALTGAEDAPAALALFNPGQLARDAAAGLNALLDPLSTGETETIRAALSAAAVDFECRRISGEITADSIAAAMTQQPLLRSITSFIQAAAIETPDPGAISAEGAYGFYGNAGDESAVYRLTLTVAGAAYDAKLTIDNSTAITAVAADLTGAEGGMALYVEDWPSGYSTMKLSGRGADGSFEITQTSTQAGIFRLDAALHDAASGETTSLTATANGADYYAAISTSSGGSETCAYVYTDTRQTEPELRAGTLTLGLYRAGSRTELCCDLTIDSSAGVGEGRAVSAARATEILAMTAEDWNRLADDLVNSINGAMYVLSMYVPGFTYDAIAPADFGGQTSDAD